MLSEMVFRFILTCLDGTAFWVDADGFFVGGSSSLSSSLSSSSLSSLAIGLV